MVSNLCPITCFRTYCASLFITFYLSFIFELCISLCVCMWHCNVTRRNIFTLVFHLLSAEQQHQHPLSGRSLGSRSTMGAFVSLIGHPTVSWLVNSRGEGERHGSSSNNVVNNNDGFFLQPFFFALCVYVHVCLCMFGFFFFLIFFENLGKICPFVT